MQGYQLITDMGDILLLGRSRILTNVVGYGGNRDTSESKEDPLHQEHAERASSQSSNIWLRTIG